MSCLRGEEDAKIIGSIKISEIDKKRDCFLEERQEKLPPYKQSLLSK